MKSIRTVTTVETHTEGMPTRVVTSGIGEIPGASMFEAPSLYGTYGFLAPMVDV